MKKENICVIGAGRLGRATITQLHKLNKSVLVIDKDVKNLNSIKDYASHIIEADAADINTLEAIGFENIDTVIVALADNIEIIAALLELEVKNIIARAVNKRHARVLKQIGVNWIVSPEEEAGIRLALFSTNNNFFKYSETLQELPGGFVIGSTTITSPKYIGKTIKNSKFSNLQVSVVIIKRETTTILPFGEFVFNKDDLVTFIGQIDNVIKVFELVNQHKIVEN